MDEVLFHQRRPSAQLDPAAPPFFPSVDLNAAERLASRPEDPDAYPFFPRHRTPPRPTHVRGPCTLTPVLSDGPNTATGHHGRGRPAERLSPVHRRGPRLTTRDWSFMPGQRNLRRRRNLKRKISYSDEGEVSVPLETNKKKTGLRWRQKSPRSLKFVDDSMLVSKVNMDSAELSVRVSGRQLKTKHDIHSQNNFRRIVGKAESRGMVVNNAKTKVLCVSDAQTYEAAAYLKDDNDVVVSSSGSMKVLGFHLEARPSCHAHVKALQLRMRDT